MLTKFLNNNFMIIYYTMQLGEVSGNKMSDTYPTGLRFYEPERVKDIPPESYRLKSKSNHYGYNYCPAYQDFLHNLYAFKCPIDYSLNVDVVNNMVGTNHYSENEFHKFINVRSVEDKLFSFYTQYSLYTDLDSLTISQMPAFLHSNSFTDNTVLIPGTFDIAKWPRPLSCAFHVKSNTVAFEEAQTLFYVKFNTAEKIEFKLFYETERLRDLKSLVLNSKNLKSKPKNLPFYYRLFNNKKGLKQLMLKEIKANVLD